ncbi:Zn-dependent hydrolase of beta-lactamase, putative [Trichomonas vaginalis G3]|uniref:Zn-dependent hydrolase of beta-lactamase, putative n=1 Tax=Trichomonas vaginalis (strain ATCC PRA-98 / G3) TaxID=412133 RepID=A2ES70_TRIV3|nr:N-acetylphosphatidylethanolamine-hydrolyzing phospholipas protein [Trichomonas vaginalis G3]EAY04507.1 Zn-dependent hydrolase of beta-lactamase, putative [Trichomonas vaginalis G3]KAI5503267.1 N-acetylphosphatidylethanolamine-hydrolyzing phospholipas protein [Trichomonas vaginalis G3]|eukprot:XP_001316730.1 Zn-dependent hydrolase of beta-lactamase [Trichomonas vaginalis G3]
MTFFSNCGLSPEQLSTYNTLHHKEDHFINNDGEPQAPEMRGTGFKTTIKFFTSRDVTTALPHRDPTPDFELGNGIRDWWIGHATNLIQINDKFMLTDPIFDKYASPIPGTIKRQTPPACEIEKLPKISFVLVSHCHWDHLNKYSIKKLAQLNPDCKFFAPLNVGKMMVDWGIKNVTEFDWRTHLVVDDIDFTCFPSHHGSARWGNDQNRTLWCSWMITSGNCSIYYTGDTAIGPHFKEIKETLGRGPDLFIVGIGPQNPPEMMRAVHMDGKDTREMAKLLEPVRVVPMHYGTFPLGFETEKTDLQIFMDHAEPEKAIVIDIGGRVDWNGQVFVKGA